MFSWWTQKNEHVLDLQRNYLKIEFLTEDQKIKKNLLLQQLNRTYKDSQEEVIIPYEQSINCSFRFNMNTNDFGNKQKISNKIMVKQVVAHLQITTKSDLSAFIQSNVRKMNLFMQNNKALEQNQVLELYNQRDVSLYCPQQVFEVIYTQTGLWQRIKNTAKQKIKQLPKALIKLSTKLIGFFLMRLGVDLNAQSLLLKVIPYKTILIWILTFISMIFPPLAPFLGISKMII